MISRHVTSLAAMFFGNLLLCSVQSQPSPALLKLLAHRTSHDSPNIRSLSRRYPSYLSPDNSLLPSSPEDVNWMDSPSSNPLLMRAGNSLTSAGSPEEETEDNMVETSKRFPPSAFFGSRGKRRYDASEGYAKRFFQGFVGSRGKRMPAFLGRGEEVEEEEEEKRVGKRFDPSAFTGSRGKRYLPGLEALFLSQMYKKLDAEKWKRQSLLGFHAARG